MKNLLVAFTLFSSIVATAQKSPVKFGDIPMEDLKMTVYSKDSSAAAVVLEDYGIAYITVIGDAPVLNFERHTRIKILTKEGLDYANTSILVYHAGSTEEKVQALKAASYNLENGKVVESKLSKDNIFKEKVNRNYNRQKFAVPNVKVGSVIEYSYRISSEFFTNFPNWSFQSTIPTRWSEYWAMIPDLFTYEKYMQGYVPPSSYETKRQLYYETDVIGHHWISRNVPAFKEESYMTSADEYISKMNFALSRINYSTHIQEVMASWEKLTKDLLEDEDFGKAIDKTGFLKDRVSQITNGVTDSLKKVIAISEYVKNNVEWDGEEDYYAGNIKKILETKSGTSGDINIILASMLDKAGFDVEMILLSTRGHGIIRQAYPMRKQFNYVVASVKIGGKRLLLDATEKNLPYDVLPSRCLNGQGLIISKKNFGWLEVTSKAKAKTVVNVDLTISGENELSGKIQYTMDGYDAHDNRDELLKNGEEKYLKDFKGTKQWQFEKSEFQDVKDLSKPLKESHQVIISDHITSAGDILYINPFVSTRIEENPFKSDQRTYPIDFGTQIDRTYILKLTVPENFAIDDLPKNKVIALPGNVGKYILNVTPVGNVINITSIFQINRSMIAQTEYANVKEFYNQVVAKQAEQIVLKKK
ncbi:MAG: DUF3857 domain-containing protein [Bacteroidetes bacterium]|nr:DUF3857 domain-containing protein [Bacteroidota bacterium]